MGVFSLLLQRGNPCDRGIHLVRDLSPAADQSNRLLGRSPGVLPLTKLAVEHHVDLGLLACSGVEHL